jgi:hypothetical protein
MSTTPVAPAQLLVLRVEGRNKRVQRAFDLNSDMLLDPISLPLPPRRAAKSTKKTVAAQILPPLAIEMT